MIPHLPLSLSPPLLLWVVIAVPQGKHFIFSVTGDVRRFVSTFVYSAERFDVEQAAKFVR